MFCQRLFLLLIGVTCSTTAFAQDHSKKRIDAQKVTSISYGSSSWNEDSAKVDSAYLVMRDKASGKIVQIQLEETEPDSSHFSGQFSVNLRQGEAVMPEIFVPPQELRKTDQDNRKLYEMIQSGRLVRKPVIWTKNERGQPMLDVYDTRDQAEAALKAYRETEKITAEAKRSGGTSAGNKLPGATAMAAAKQAAYQAQLSQLALDASKRESERVRMEQIEKQKAAEREKAAQGLSEKERAERRARAAKLAAEGLALYEAGKFPEAESKLKESIDLDPDNKDTYFNYGVTLYRTEKFNEALVTMKMAKSDPKTDLERGYYMGLIHYRLKELDAAMGQFNTVAASKDPVMGPSAEFYRGVISFAQEKYEDSKKSFETVIDTSSDARLDEQAETYLDRIASAMAFQRMRENKFTFTGTIGGMYDSNVLLSPDNTGDQGSSTDVADFRLLTIADLEYRPVFSEHHEWSAKGNVSLTNSLKDEAAIADPWIYNLTLPYSYKGVMWSKGFKFSAKPGYEMLYMDPTNSGSKTKILASYFVAFDTTFVMRPNWFSIYTFEYRADDTTTADSVGPADSDAAKYSLKTTQMFFLDKARKEALMVNLGYVLNAANGDDRKYDRIEAGAIYMRPGIWNATWNGGLALYQLSYGDAAIKRDDFNVMILAGLSKPVKDWLTWGVNASYTKNDSNLSANEYSKYMVMTTATFTQIF